MTTKKADKQTHELGGANELNSFRLYLQSELARRCSKNPNYSVRAFAKSLSIEHSSLAKILSGKRLLTAPMIQRLAKNLELSPSDVKKYTDTSIEDFRTLRTAKKMAQVTQISADEFTMISEWYHYAILELARTQNCPSNTKWIASALGISEAETLIAIDRLKRLNFIHINEQEYLVAKLGANNSYKPSQSEAPMRRLQRQFLEKAIGALDNFPVNERDQSAVTLAVDKSRIYAAKKLIAQFRQELVQFLMDDHNNLNSVYQFSISLFPLIKKELPHATKKSQ